MPWDLRLLESSRKVSVDHNEKARFFRGFRIRATRAPPGDVKIIPCEVPTPRNSAKPAFLPGCARSASVSHRTCGPLANL